MDDNNIQKTEKVLLQDLRQIINGARIRVAAKANSELTMMYWHIGERINREVLGNQRAEYGKQIVASVVRQLSWSHFLEIMPLKDELQREFYLTLAAAEHWSKRRLRQEIDGMLYERIAFKGYSYPAKPQVAGDSQGKRT